MFVLCPNETFSPRNNYQRYGATDEVYVNIAVSSAALTPRL